MPKAVAEEEIRTLSAPLSARWEHRPIREMGLVMKNVMAKFQAQAARAEGKMVSETVKQELGKA